ncbi:MAG: prolyl oligopeptidase family serine peptidase [Prevotella sp.]|nr:prolyl oligopeptidase family serine peptidase [Prevotella sp.]
MKKIGIISMAIMVTTMVQAQCSMQYPQTEKDNTVDEYFGVKVSDPYRWLENDTSAQTTAWVEAENKVTSTYLRKIPFRDKLLKRLTELSNYEKIGAPSKHHNKWYFSRNNGLQNQSVIYVMDKLDGKPRIFLDPNTLSADGTVALKSISFSNNGRWAAYAISRSGSDWQEFYVIDVNTGQLTNDHIEWAKFSDATWLGDGFYYSAYDRPIEYKEFSNLNSGHKIYYHKIGTSQSDDVLFYQNPTEPMRFYNVEINEDETVMYLYESGAGAGNILYVRDLRQKDAQFVKMTSDMNYQYSPIYSNDDKLYIYTNYGAPKGRIMMVDIHKPGINDWQELIPEQQNVLGSATVINRQLVLTYSQDASDHAFIYGLDGQMRHEVKLPMVGSVNFSGNEKESDCFYTFTSFTQPGTVYRYDIDANLSTIYAQPRVKFRLQDYESRQLFFESKDGTRIPMYITYKKGMKRSGKNPVYLYGYGGFNIALTPSFSSTRIPFLEQGGIYAQVNLRGGSEYGEEWHLAGTKMQKQNVFDDFIAAAEYLIKEKYTCSDRLAIVGGSNGGLLVGACMTQRPDLYHVAIPQVGVMDMLRYHKFTIGWNWASDYGTSDDSKEMFEYLRTYSPLHNLKPGISYPATLVTTADHDDRVVPAHSFKFTATLQECHKGLNPVLIRIDTKAGHGGGKPLAKVLEEQADIYSFILFNMGMKFK